MKEDIKSILWCIGLVLIIYAIFYGGMMFQKYTGEPRIIYREKKVYENPINMEAICYKLFEKNREGTCKTWQEGYEEGYHSGISFVENELGGNYVKPYKPNR